MSKITISEHIEQMSPKGQDHTVSGETTIDGIVVTYAAVFDGHGENPVIHFIRSIPKNALNEIMAMPCPATTLFHLINQQTPKLCETGRCSGSTMCLARIFPTHVEIINVGDSQAVVSKNGEIEFVSETHDYFNEKEKARLHTNNLVYQVLDSSSVKIVNKSEMRKTKAFYIRHLNDGVTLAVSQALGHNGKTGICPDRTVIPYFPGDRVDIILGSDGLFDMVIRELDSDAFVESDLLEMLAMPGQEIMKRACDRWLQEWTMYYDLDNPNKSAKYQWDRSSSDDVAVVKALVIGLDLATGDLATGNLATGNLATGNSVFQM
jgi:serine/threonine protein phosphatase PrpC